MDENSRCCSDGCQHDAPADLFCAACLHAAEVESCAHNAAYVAFIDAMFDTDLTVTECLAASRVQS
jgi:hypothetical protein